MLGWLSDIWHAIMDLPFLIIDLLVMVLNALIAAVGALAQALFSLLPDMPDPPDEPPSVVLEWLSFFFPLGQLFVGFSVLAGLWATFLIIRMGLNWVKAL